MKSFNRVFTPEELASYQVLIGCKVHKKRGYNTEPKPFKSGVKVNTVKSITLHPITGYPAFNFYEDESIVECFRCKLAPSLELN